MKQFLKTLWINIINRNNNVKIRLSTTVGLHSVFEGNNRIGRNVFFRGRLGRGSYIGDRCQLSADIGRYCSIGSNVTCAIGSHPTQKWVSTHPSFYSTKQQAGFSYVNEDKFSEIIYANNEKRIPILIGNDVWIGNDVLLISGIHIGDGAIIGAGAVVTHNVEPFDIVAGVPARSIRKRFTQEQIEMLLKTKWWDKSDEWNKQHADIFYDITVFMETVTKEMEHMNNENL